MPVGALSCDAGCIPAHPLAPTAHARSVLRSRRRREDTFGPIKRYHRYIMCTMGIMNSAARSNNVAHRSGRIIGKVTHVFPTCPM
jgi:hypothetical protein